MRSAWISDVLTQSGRSNIVKDKAARANLEKELKILIPATKEKNAAFFKTICEEIDAYHQISQPNAKDTAERERKLENLVMAGRAFSRAVKSLDQGSKDLLVQAQWSVLGKSEFPKLACTTNAGLWAETTAKAADNLIRNIKKKRRSGPSQDSAQCSLIAIIAEAYACVFGERASPAREGIFARSINVILKASGILHDDDDDIGETKLRGILKDRPNIASAPKRGRKLSIAANSHESPIK